MENRGGQQKESQLHYNSKLPWELIHCDLFEFQGRNYLSINDDFSGMLFAYKLKDMTTHTTYTVRNKWEKLEHIGKVIFDIPFMTQNHAESMKKILGAV